MGTGEIQDPGTPASGEAPAGGTEPAAPESTGSVGAERRHERSSNMLPGRERRRFGLERLVVRLIATCGIVGIGVLLGAILANSKVQGWIIGLVIGAVSVVLSAILWSSRQM